MNIKDYDSSIDNTQFLTKVDNIFILLISGVMFDELDKAKHKISEEVFNKYQSIIDSNKEKNIIQMYDEMNVKSTTIIDIRKTSEKIIVKVNLVSRYLDYIIDSNTGAFISGNNTERKEHYHKLVLEKRVDAKGVQTSMHCPTCGKPANVNATGICEYCGSLFNTDDYDYVLTSIETY